MDARAMITRMPNVTIWPAQRLVSWTKISMHGAHCLMCLVEDSGYKQCLPLQRCWHPRSGIKLANFLSSAGRLAANQATKAG